MIALAVMASSMGVRATRRVPFANAAQKQKEPEPHHHHRMLKEEEEVKRLPCVSFSSLEIAGSGNSVALRTRASRI